MTNVVSREITQVWVTHSIPLPAMWGDLTDLVMLVRQALGDSADWDDSAQVIATDEELIVRWEKPPGREPAPGIGPRWADRAPGEATR